MSSIEVPIAVPRVDVLGVRVSAINMDDALEVIDEWITSGERQYVCVTGVHGVMESQRDESLRRIHNAAGLVTPDGMPLVWISKRRGFRNTTRVYGPDLMLAVCERSLATGYRHFFYGGQEGVPDRLVRRLEKRFPGTRCRRHVLAAVQVPDAGGERRHHPAHQRCEAGHRLGRAGHAEAGAMDGGPRRPAHGVGARRRRRRVRLSRRRETSGAAVDAAERARMVLPAGDEPKRLGRRYLVNNPSFVWLTLLQTWRASATTPTPGFADTAPSRTGL